MRDVAHIIATSIACLKEKFNVLIICGLHNKRLAEYIILKSYTVGAYPYLWVFDEKFLLTHAKFYQETCSAFFLNMCILF